jgi:hypothetical protein
MTQELRPVRDHSLLSSQQILEIASLFSSLHIYLTWAFHINEGLAPLSSYVWLLGLSFQGLFMWCHVLLLHSFYGWICHWWICHIMFSHLLDRYFCSHFLAVIYVTINTLYAFLCGHEFSFLVCIPKDRIVGSQGTSLFSTICQTFQSICTILHSHQHVERVQVLYFLWF